MKPRRWYPFGPDVDAPGLSEVVAHHPVTLVHVWADWNSADRTLDSHLQELQRLHEGQFRTFSMDIDEEGNWGFLADQGVMNVPTVLVFVRGRPVGHLVGLRTKKEWTALTDRILRPRWELRSMARE